MTGTVRALDLLPFVPRHEQGEPDPWISACWIYGAAVGNCSPILQSQLFANIHCDVTIVIEATIIGTTPENIRTRLVKSHCDFM